MKRLHRAMLEELGSLLPAEERDEMAIPSYLHRNPVMREIAWLRVHRLAQRFALEAERFEAERRRLRRVVDFGCGAGVLLAHLASLADEVIAVDVVPEPARVVVERLGLRNVRVMTPDDLAALEAGSIDAIVAGEVLEHVDPLGPTIWAFERLLAPDGILLATLPTENRLYRLGRRLAGFTGHYHHDNARSIDAALRRAGFRRDHLSWVPLPGPLAIYWILAYRRPLR